jgi:hypothetical protein
VAIQTTSSTVKVHAGPTLLTWIYCVMFFLLRQTINL